jgi:hypothetical protein
MKDSYIKWKFIIEDGYIISFAALLFFFLLVITLMNSGKHLSFIMLIVVFLIGWFIYLIDFTWEHLEYLVNVHI